MDRDEKMESSGGQDDGEEGEEGDGNGRSVGDFNEARILMARTYKTQQQR
jgi:hypothetical protein